MNASGFTGQPYHPNPIGRGVENRVYRTGVSFDITAIPDYMHITRVELNIDLRKYSNWVGSEVKIKKMAQNVTDYTSAYLFWYHIGAGTTYRSNMSPSGTQTISFSSNESFVSDIRTALIDNGIVSIGFESHTPGTEFTLVNLYSISLKVYYKLPGVTVKNSFDGVSAGVLKVDGATYNSGVQFNWSPYENHTAEAIDQSYAGYDRIFQEWRRNGQGISQQRSISINSDAGVGNITYEADFKKRVNITVRNNFAGTGNGGIIKVNGNNVNSPYTMQMMEKDNLTIQAITPQTYNGIDYNFVNWSDGSTANPRTVTPSVHTTYTANFNIIASPPAAPTISIGASGYNPILSWSSVSGADSYTIYRGAVPHYSSCETAIFGNISTTSQTSFIDFGVFIEPISEDMACYYVTSYKNYVGESIPSNIVNIRALVPYSRNDELISNMTLDLPHIFSVSDNFPNPFNPTTSISFAIPEVSRVLLIVYDIMGREVQRLVDDVVDPGYHAAVWDGRNASGSPSASGVYIYRFSAIPVSSESTNEGVQYVKKMLFTK